MQLPPYAIETWPVDRPKPYERNARTHSKKQVKQLAESFRQYGQVWPLLVREDGTLIAGHGRLEAARAAGLTEVRVIVAAGWTEEQCRAFGLLDNRVPLNAEWDEEALAAELKDLAGFGVDLGGLGFDAAELASLPGTGGHTGQTDPDDVPRPPKCPAAIRGDLWALGRHRIACGDVSDPVTVENLLASASDPQLRASVALIVTSPPYNQGIDKFKPSGMHREGDWVAKVGRLAYNDSLPEAEYQAWQRSLLDQWYDILSDGGSLFYNHKNRYREKRVVSPLEWLPGKFNLRQEIIWRRPGSVTQNARMFLPCDERIFWLYKGKDFQFDDATEIKSFSTVWDIVPSTNKQHAVAFPIELPGRCIRACSRPHDYVFDPFCGSGTTIIACEQYDRRCLGIELSPAYVDVSIIRWQDFTGQSATLAGDGRTFAEVKAEREALGSVKPDAQAPQAPQ